VTVQPEALDRCPWLCSAPGGPNTPFAWPVLFVVDSLRVLITVGSVVLVIISVWAIRRSVARGQVLRFLGVVPIYFYVLGTELDHLGDWPHWRFVTGLTGISLLLWGYWEHLYRELPAREKLNRDRTTRDP
jgi:hypothetical protein